MIDTDTAEAEQDANAVFTSLLTRWNEAIVTNDAHLIGAFADPSWAFVGENGIFRGEDFLASVAAGRVSHDLMTSDLHDVRVYGDVAVVIARVRNRGEYEGHPFTLDEWSTDVFVRRDGTWQCVLTHLTAAAPDAPSPSADER
jgi:ketosteroid isomerase-like protein